MDDNTNEDADNAPIQADADENGSREDLKAENTHVEQSSIESATQSIADGMTTASTGAADSSSPNEDKGNKCPNPFKFFVGGIHPEAFDEDVRRHFSQFGAVKEVHVMIDRGTLRNRGFGFVTMEDDSTRDTIFTAFHAIRDKKLNVREMQPDGTSNLKRKVFIGGINPALNEDDLEPYFKNLGPVEKVTVMRDVEGTSRGFGFVVFMDEQTCKKVVDMGIHYIDAENKVECRQAEKARGRGPTPRGRGGRGGRDSRGYGYMDGRGYGYDEYGGPDAFGGASTANYYGGWYGYSNPAAYGSAVSSSVVGDSRTTQSNSSGFGNAYATYGGFGVGGYSANSYSGDPSRGYGGGYGSSDGYGPQHRFSPGMSRGGRGVPSSSGYRSSPY